MASRAHRWSGESPLIDLHGGTKAAAKHAVNEAKRRRLERSREIARAVVERAMTTERKDRVRRRASMRLIENDQAPPYLPHVEVEVRPTSGLTSMHVLIWERCGGRCHYCGTVMMRMPNEPLSFTLDHVVPRSRGGSHRSSNIVGSCARCNNEKGSLTGEEYAAVLEVRRRRGAPK